MVCPDPTALNCYCIGGQFSPAICDVNETWPELRVQAEIINPTPDPLQDPTNCSIVTQTITSNELEDTNGCWCIGPLMPNYHPTDPDMALQPSGSSWRIVVQAVGANGQASTIFGPIEVQLDGSVVVEDLDECCQTQGPCGVCLNIVCLLDIPATVPPTDRFCDAVQACLAPITGLGLLGGDNVSGNYDDGWFINLECEDIQTCLPDLPTLTGLNAAGQLIFTDGGGTTTTHQILSQDPDQLITLGSDNGLFLDCLAVNGCVHVAYVDYDPAIHDLGIVEGDGTEANPYQVPVRDCDQVAQCVNAVYVPYDPAVHANGTIVGDGTVADPFQIPLNPDLLITTDGTVLGVTQTESSVDIVVTDPDAGNVAEIGPGGGTLVTADAVCAAVNATCPASAVDNGDGTYTVTGTDGSTITFCGCGDVVDNGDGSYTWTGSDGDVVTWNTSEVIVSADADNILTAGTDGGAYLSCETVNGCVNFEYVQWDPLVHDAGLVEGDGSTAAPYQIPLPQIDVEITDIAITNTVVNPDGSTTVTYTVTETDDGDADPATHNFDVVFPAAAQVFYNYVTYDPLVHDAGVIEGDGTSANPYQIPVPDFCTLATQLAPAAGDIIPADDEVLVVQSDGTCARKTLAPAAAETPLAVTTDGTATGVALSGTSNHVADITVTSADADNIAVIGSDGGTAVTCDAVNGCVNIEYVAYDSLTHTVGTVTGDGSSVAPYQVPLPPEDIDAVYVYTTYDPLVHTDGTLAGAGTTADPYQIPLPADLCDMLSALAAATGDVAAGDELLVLDPVTGVCRRATLPPGTTDTNTTYTLADNGDGSFTLTDSDGGITTIGVCDLLDDLTSTGATIPAGVEILGSDCQWHMLPAGTTDTFVTFVDNGDGTATFTGADGVSTVAVCTGPCDHTTVASVDNGDGTFTYTATMPDGSTETWTVGDADTTYTLADNGDTTFTLTDSNGTATQIGLCDLVDDATQVATYPAGALVLTYDPVAGSCQLAPSTDADTTYTLVDNGDGSWSLVDDASTVISTIPICDLVDDLTQVASIPAGSLIIAHDPVAGTCQLAPLPAGTTDTFVTFADNSDGSATFTSADGLATLDVCLLPCANDQTFVYHEGDTAPTDVTLSDGTTLPAGSPVPAGEVVIVDYDPDGVLIRENAFTVGGDVCDSVSGLPAATADIVTGDQVLALDGTTGECALKTIPDGCPELCDELAALPAGTCTETTNLVTDQCEVLSADEVTPAHALAQCDSVGETIDTFSSVSSITSLTQTDLGSTQFGYIVPDISFGDTEIPAGTIPIDIAVPAATPGCVLSLHLAYGGMSDHWAGVSASLTGTDVANLTLVGHSGAADDFITSSSTNDDSVQQTVYFMDAVSGAAGSTITVDFTTFISDPENAGVFVYHWSEICDGGGGTVTVADFDIAGVQTSYADPLTSNDGTFEAWDLGDCPSVVFAVGRHVAPNLSDFSLNAPTNWWEAAGVVTETYDMTSNDNATACQLGWASGIIPGGSGSYQAEFHGNDFADDFVNDPVASQFAVPIANCSGATGAVTTAVNQCDIEICNPNCVQSGVAQCYMMGSAEVVAPAGTFIKVTPVVNGVPITAQTQGIESGQAVLAWSFHITDSSTIIPPGGCVTHTFTWQVESSTGLGSAILSDWTSECEVIHV